MTPAGDAPPVTPDAALVLGLAGRQAVGAGHRLLDPRRLEQACAGAGVGREAFAGAVGALRAAGLVDAHTSPGGGVALLQLTDAGLRGHLDRAGPSIAEVAARVVAALRGDEAAWAGSRAVDLAGAVGAPSLAVEVALDDLARRGAVVFSRAPGRRVRIHRLATAT